MANYLAPGVYVEEVDTSPKPITGVSTSVAGFIGVTRRGPTTGLPRLVTSFADFRRKFGGYLDVKAWGNDGYLAYAVQGFFDNGGRLAYIMRVPGQNAGTSSLKIQDGIITQLEDVAGDPTVRLASLRGIDKANNNSLTFEANVGGNQVTRNRDVQKYDVSAGTVTLNNTLNLDAAGTKVIVRDPAGGAGDILEIKARNPGVWGDDLSVRFRYTNPVRAEVVPQVVMTLTPLDIPLSFHNTVDPNHDLEGKSSVHLSDASQLETGDVVEFSEGEEREQRTITAFDSNNNNIIKWNDALKVDYTGNASIRIVTAVRAKSGQIQLLPAGQTNIFAPGDILMLSQGDKEDEVEIAAGWTPGNSPITLDSSQKPSHNYLEGAALTLKSPAVRQNQQNTVRVRSARNFYKGAHVLLDNGTNREYFTVTGINGNTITLNASPGNNYHVGNFVYLAAFALDVRYRNQAQGIDETESFTNLTLNADVLDRYVVNVVNDSSRYVEVEDLRNPPNRGADANPTTESGSWQPLTGGSDGSPPEDQAYLGQDNGPGQRSGIKAMSDIDEVSIIAVPGKTEQVIQNELIIHCEQRMDRFAVLDPDPDLRIQEVRDFRNRYSSQYAALYYPWLMMRDPLSGNNMKVPPSGHIVGIYARTDNDRGVHKAPANTVVRGITGLNMIVNKREQDILNPHPININVIRDFRNSNRGIRVWGARVLTSDSAWKYVPVRRLFIFVEESLDEGLQWVVFEPNAEPLWARVRQSITNFLITVWRNGALMGTSQEQAFFVRCDETTMTDTDIKNGRLICEVGIAPVYPAEYVIIRIQQYTAEAQ